MENVKLNQQKQAGVQIDTPRETVVQQPRETVVQQPPRQNVKPLPAAFMSLVAKEIDSVTLSISKLNLLEFVKGLSHEAIKTSFENPSQADLIRMFAKEIDNDDAKMERMLATYFPSAKNSVTSLPRSPTSPIT